MEITLRGKKKTSFNSASSTWTRHIGGWCQEFLPSSPQSYLVCVGKRPSDVIMLGLSVLPVATDLHVARCCVSGARSQVCHVTKIRMKPRCFLLPCQLHWQAASLRSSLIWSDAVQAVLCVEPGFWFPIINHGGATGLSDADAGCQLLPSVFTSQFWHFACQWNLFYFCLTLLWTFTSD